MSFEGAKFILGGKGDMMWGVGRNERIVCCVYVIGEGLQAFSDQGQAAAK